MENVEIVKCYCFNPLCKSSIFALNKNITIWEPLERVLSEPIHCKDCHTVLISKPVLEIKIQVDNCLLYRPAGMEPRVITKDRFFMTI
ncbi:hypothetical protein [Mucilaginibacter panaciglaebae]|uniref:hypothetical protein n=1 Tax=Mucilaginibacter panaciglaebae TaxID=502331 RepID=UPI0031F17215